MNILIVGGAGYIGGVTAHLAVESGHTVTVFDNLSSGLKHNLPAEATLIEGNVTSYKDIQTAFSGAQTYDVVLHFAAKILVPESMQKPHEYLQTNSFGLLNMVEAATRASVSNYILSSTAAVYGAPEIFPIDESAPKQPVNPYGESKLIAEHILASYQEAKGLNWLAFRYFNVAGAYAGVGPDYPFVSHVIPALLDRAYKKQPFTIFGNDYCTEDGTCVRDFVHVRDIGRAHITAAEKMLAGDSFNTAINLGSATGYSVKQITDAFLDITKKQLQISYAPRRPGDPDQLVASNEKAGKLLGWQPEDNLEKIIRDQAEWYDALPATARVKNIGE
jgi:UDP-glucose 4-epimerase